MTSYANWQINSMEAELKEYKKKFKMLIEQRNLLMEEADELRSALLKINFTAACPVGSIASHKELLDRIEDKTHMILADKDDPYALSRTDEQET